MRTHELRHVSSCAFSGVGSRTITFISTSSSALSNGSDAYGLLAPRTLEESGVAQLPLTQHERRESSRDDCVDTHSRLKADACLRFDDADVGDGVCRPLALDQSLERSSRVGVRDVARMDADAEAMRKIVEERSPELLVSDQMRGVECRGRAEHGSLRLRRNERCVEPEHHRAVECPAIHRTPGLGNPSVSTEHEFDQLTKALRGSAATAEPEGCGDCPT